MNFFVKLSATLAIFCLFVAAQTAKTDSTPSSNDTGAKTEIRKVPAPQISAASGEANYKAYCAACHGASGKGDGPAAPALKLPPTDLTRLAANTGGKFPAMHVQTMIRDAEGTAHGSKDMPVWGPVFRSVSRGNQADVELRVNNLTKYIESIQAK
jgi:mono/diheme cytochrome c family protein